jgi:hypothetical protein
MGGFTTFSGTPYDLCELLENVIWKLDECSFKLQKYTPICVVNCNNWSVWATHKLSPSLLIMTFTFNKKGSPDDASNPAQKDQYFLDSGRTGASDHRIMEPASPMNTPVEPVKKASSSEPMASRRHPSTTVEPSIAIWQPRASGIKSFGAMSMAFPMACAQKEIAEAILR